jgi:predicted secreted protein
MQMETIMKVFLAGTALLATMMLTTLAALAGDFANREIHGFSEDGKLFAFEEYGRQDGSGFAYSNLFIIDTTTDRWTANSPYRVLLRDENSAVFDAREQVRMQAGPVMKSFEGRGILAGTNQPTEVSADAKRMSVNPRPVVPPIDEQLEFRIATYQTPPTTLCEPFGATIGFRLLKVATSDGKTTKMLHEDQNVPDSRGCPHDYSIADVVTYYPDAGTPKFAVVILVTSQGFEGPDGRFMAVTGEID